MRNNSLRKITYVIISSLLISCLSGCSLIPELTLTEEQSELIAEYAAGLLVKYQIGHSMGLVPVSASDLIEEDTPEAATIDELIGIAPAEEDSSEADAEDLLADNPEDGTIEMVSSNIPISEVFGTPNFDISTGSYELTGVYPKEESDELIFSMQASPGMELMVVHFNITNPASESAECNLMSGDVKARAIVNNGERIAAQVTILDNDLLNYDETIDGGASVDAVLVFEVPGETEAELSSLNIILDGAAGENIYNIL